MKTNPFPQLPQEVMLRNRTFATVTSAAGTGAFVLLGRTGLDVPAGHLVGEDLRGLGQPDRGHHHTWRRDGRWLETGREHAFDIVAVVTGRTGAVLQIEPYALAAGAKGAKS